MVYGSGLNRMVILQQIGWKGFYLSFSTSINKVYRFKKHKKILQLRIMLYISPIGSIGWRHLTALKHFYFESLDILD